MEQDLGEDGQTWRRFVARKHTYKPKKERGWKGGRKNGRKEDDEEEDHEEDGGNFEEEQGPNIYVIFF